MIRPHRKPHGYLFAAILLLSVAISGCGGDDDNPAAPPGPPPELTLSLDCNQGRIDLELTNMGGAMSAPGQFVAVFTDGSRDTLYLSAGAEESVTCRLSNIHGGVTVTNDEWELSATTGKCLENALSGLMDNFDIEALVPDPLLNQTIVLCDYRITMDNLTYGDPDFEMTTTATGLALKYTFRNIHGDIEAIASGLLCPDVEGDLDISSIVTTTNITIVQGSNPQVTLGSTTTTVNGLDVTIDGVMGFLTGWLVNFFEGDFADLLELGVEDAVGNMVGSDLNELFVVNSECAE